MAEGGGLEAIAAADVASGFGGIFHTGGPVSGPGTGTSDSIPAYLSDGEFVVSARMAQKHRSLLEAVNSGRFTGLRRWADGGFVLPQIPNMRPAASAAPRDEGGGGGDIYFYVTTKDADSFQRNMPQLRGLLAELQDRAKRRDN